MRSSRPTPRPACRWLLLALLPVLPGCGSLLTAGTEAGAGAAGAGIATAATENAAVASGIGIGVSAAARAGLQYARRVVHRDAQDAVAAAAGPLAPGQVGRWSVAHRLPIEPDERGQVAVTREVGGRDFLCREFVFSVETPDTGRPDGLRRAFYTAMTCRDGDRWRWASAEPAVERWGALQ